MGKIAVIGTGYVGLTTGACFAHLGHEVICADVIPEKVERLRRGDVPILEAGLPELVREGIAGGRLSFVLGAAIAAADCEFAYLCVPTPQSADGSADLSYIRTAAQEISAALPSEAIVVNKSTVPVGSTLVVEQALGREDVYVVSNPEFLREGSAVHDFLNPDRIVIGSEHQDAAIRVAALFSGINAPLIVTDPASAETIKYASNAFLATKVSFINAIAAVCESVGADVREVVLGMGYDKRIGFEFLKPGPGWGGSCFLGDETLLVRRGADVRLLRFEALFAEVECTGLQGVEVLSWRPGEPTPEFLPVAACTARPYEGDVVDIRTKMGRRLTVTADHPLFVSDGVDADELATKAASELTVTDWLPVAQGQPFEIDAGYGRLLDVLATDLVREDQVIVRLDDVQRMLVERRADRLPASRKRDVLRAGAMRLHELRALGIPTLRGRFGTTTNGTYVPDTLPYDEPFWRMVGLFLAEGHIGTDGQRRRICWSFHPDAEADLVDFVANYWRAMGVKTSVRRQTTTMQVSISSRILAGWLEAILGVGSNCYVHRIPDAIWTAPTEQKKALLRGIWDGDGSWSYVARGSNVVFEFGTVSRALADGVVRLLGDLGIVARLRVGRVAKSTVDTYWVMISGAAQLERCLWLFPPQERAQIGASIQRLQKRIAPTGYRRLSKNAAWVRVVSAASRRYAGTVYSVEVPIAHTVVTSFGLVAHQCFPKDTRALIHIAEVGGYDFDLLRGVIAVNDAQYERVTDKIVEAAGGSVDGAIVAVWGLTFKARTDDMRESPSLEVIRRLNARGARIRAYDPAVSGPLEGVEVTADPYAACDDASVLAVLTEWDEFRWLDLDKVKAAMARPYVVDARNLLDPAPLRRRGFDYEGIGRL